jgi:hypothetical protein
MGVAGGEAQWEYQLSRRGDYAVGRVGDAVALLHDTATRCERTLPPGDPLTQVVHQSLANLGKE